MHIKIVDQYIAKLIIGTVLVVALALLGFDLFFNLVHELSVIGKGKYTLGTAFHYLALTIPSRIYIMFPWSALIGTLIGLGALASHSELVIMRVSAISVARITWAVLKAAILLMVVAVLLGEGIAPTTERLAQNKRTLALSGGQTINTAYGLWIRQGEEFIHVQTVQFKGELYGVTRYRFTADQKLQETLYAQTAVKQGKQWQLKNVRGTTFLSDKTEVFEQKEMLVSHLLEAEILETAMVKHPERLSIPALWRVIRHQTKNELSAQNYELALWTKILQPFVILMMVFLAAPFVFGPLRTVSMGFRIVVGILVAFSFHTINNLFAPLAVVYQLPAIWAVLSPIIVFSGVGVWLLKRAK